MKRGRITGSRTNDDELSLYDSDIADCLLIEILIRLPLKSIFQFKTVSKRWLFLISNPFFARYYVNRINNDLLPSQYSHQWILLYRHLFKDKEINRSTAFTPRFPGGLLSSSSSSSGLSYSFLPMETESFLCLQILSSSNGLVLCCVNKHPLKYYVCNPLTRKYVTLPEPNSFGKGIDACIVCQDDGYHVVRIPSRKSSTNMLELEIFSSETGKWRVLNFSCPFPYSRYILGSGVVSYNGIPHWTVDESTRIFAYDPNRSTSQFYWIDLPKCAKISAFRIAICCSRLCCFMAGESLTLWELANYESGEWHLKHTCRENEVWSNDSDLNRMILRGDRVCSLPIAIHPFDMDTVYVKCRNYGLISFNFQTRKMQIIRVHSGSVLGMFLHAFVLPPWPTSIPQPSWRYSAARSL